MASAEFEDALQHVLGIEGSYSDHPDDSGGKTRFGIIESEAREHGYEGDMRDLPLKVAKDIYHEGYWQELRLAPISTIYYPLAEELFDTGVNMGTEDAARYLQRSLNALNRQERDYSDIAVDGIVGPKTLDALRAFSSKRGSRGLKVLVKMLNSLQGAKYVRIAEENEALESFVYGWFRLRV